MVRGRGRPRGRPRLQPLAGSGNLAKTNLQLEKTPVANVEKVTVILEGNQQKQHASEGMIQDAAKRLDLSVSPISSTQSGKSTEKIADLASTSKELVSTSKDPANMSKAVQDLAPVNEEKPAWTSLFAAENEHNQYEQPRRRRGPVAPLNAQVGPQQTEKVIQEWRVKKTADIKDPPAVLVGADQQEKETNEKQPIDLTQQPMGQTLSNL
ncbi:hypothetical protein A4A49_61440 [Nicotiana attenuata]|uniref:Uncharacterized protein n=1 Tax=Nicotiana attenuata TaxID=49451 RepID=A0A1J6IYR8_NICAT|nr:hypothetical protein A4A49_61440 [Nicotiana attenuata]